MTQSLSTEQLTDFFDRNTNFKLIDVLSLESFQNYHIDHAQNVPFDRDFDDHIVAVVPDRDTPVVLYCQNRFCDASQKAAERMEAMGYTNVHIYADGKEGWRDAGLSLVS